MSKDKTKKNGLILQKMPKKSRKGIGGRPKRTTKEFPRNWRALILKEMGEGASIQEIKAMLGIWDGVYRRMLQDEPEFAACIDQGKMLSEAWWLRTGRLQMFNKEFSATLWYMNMKNRFGWTDKQENTHVMDIPVRITIQKAERTIELKPPDQKALNPGDDYGD